MGYGMAGRHLPIPGGQGGYGGARGGRRGSPASGSASPVTPVHANRVPMHPGGFYYGQVWMAETGGGGREKACVEEWSGVWLCGHHFAPAKTHMSVHVVA